MSFQPFPCTWKSWIPLTIAAASAREYALRPAVWCTIAKRTSEAKAGGPRRILSSAPQDDLSTIGGVVVAVGVRSGTSVSGLQTRCARTRATRPVTRASIRSDQPVHHGLPVRQSFGVLSREP